MSQMNTSNRHPIDWNRNEQNVIDAGFEATPKFQKTVLESPNHKWLIIDVIIAAGSDFLF